jgi:hypothetical protein
MSILVLILYFIVMAFIVCSAVMVAGQGLYTSALCVGGTWICLIFYTFAKGIMYGRSFIYRFNSPIVEANRYRYIFFVERIHVVRAPFLRRSRDWIYLSCMVLVLVALVAQSINTYVHPVTEMQESDGRCHFGIPGIASIPGLAIDMIGGVGLTGLFFYLLHPVIKVRGSVPVSGVLRSIMAREASVTQNNKNETVVQRNIRILLWKSIVGAMLIILPTTANMIQFVITEGRELGMICLSICMLDRTSPSIARYGNSRGS